MPKVERLNKDYRLRRLSRGGIMCASGSNPNSSLKHTGREKSGVAFNTFGGVEPFRGKSGSVSFHGLTHQLVEESKLMSAPFQEEKGSFLWVLAPVALICSLILPQFFFSYAIEVFFKDETLVEIVPSFSFEVMFYIGLGVFLLVSDHVQRPYLQFSAKRWGLVTGLRGYLSSSFFAMGFRVVASLFTVYVIWPVLGFPGLAVVAPFLNFMFLMKDSPKTPDMFERGGALIGMVVTFQVLAVVCLWSLMTFLLRLFPSRLVAENY